MGGPGQRPSPNPERYVGALDVSAGFLLLLVHFADVYLSDVPAAPHHGHSVT
jgi:hypothetical protein